MLKQGKIESIEELTEILVDKRPLDEIFEKLQLEELNECDEDEEIVDFEEAVELCYSEEGESVGKNNAKREREDCNEKGSSHCCSSGNSPCWRGSCNRDRDLWETYM